jgi:hypothetical protein
MCFWWDAPASAGAFARLARPQSGRALPPHRGAVVFPARACWLLCADAEIELLAVAGLDVGVGEIVTLDQDLQVAGDADAADGGAAVSSLLDVRVDPALQQYVYAAFGTGPAAPSRDSSHGTASKPAGPNAFGILGCAGVSRRGHETPRPATWRRRPGRGALRRWFRDSRGLACGCAIEVTELAGGGLHGGSDRIRPNQDTLCCSRRSRWSAVCGEQVEGLGAVVFGGAGAGADGARQAWPSRSATTTRPVPPRTSAVAKVCRPTWAVMPSPSPALLAMD